MTKCSFIQPHQHPSGAGLASFCMHTLLPKRNSCSPKSLCQIPLFRPTALFFLKMEGYQAPRKRRKTLFFTCQFSVDLRMTRTRGLSPCRSSDGVSTAGTVVVSRLKMGEMEEADIDYISTEKTSHKVGKSGSKEEKQESLCFFRHLVLMQGLARCRSSPPMRLN